MFQILSDAEKSEIHNTAKRILSEIGIRVRNKKIYDLILETGGQADKKDKVRIYMPEKMVDKYYNSQKFSTILKYFVKRFDTPFDFYYELGLFFYEKGYLSRNISSVDYYKIFIEFNEEILKEENFVLKEIVKYDYLKYNKKKWLPDFLVRDVDKEIERKIKEKLLQSNTINNMNNIHIEKFMINILDYIDNNTIAEECRYLVYDINDEENIKDITYIVV